MLDIEGLTHIHLLVHDLERSLKFYKDVFGLEEKFRDGPSMVFLSPKGTRDLITINLASENQKHIVGQPSGIEHFGFRLRDKSQLNNAIKLVSEFGGKLVSRGSHASGQEYAYVTDPDGYTIEL
jgi:catechol 2,3-dioxygenase-like lactoylglutathione lyase family enzyme